MLEVQKGLSVKYPPKEYSDDDLKVLGLQSLASRRVNQAIRKGTLTRKDNCEVCYRTCKTHAHHWNGHSKFFDVWWICQRCNNILKGKHNGDVDLVGARKIIISHTFKRPMHYHNWLSRQKACCCICDIEDYVNNMVLFDIDYGEPEIICQRCADL